MNLPVNSLMNALAKVKGAVRHANVTVTVTVHKAVRTSVATHGTHTAFAKPISSISKAASTITGHVTRSVARHVVRHAAHAATTRPPSFFVMPHINTTLLGIGVVAIFVLVFILLMLKHIGGGKLRSVNALRLSNAVNDPTADAVGLILDLETKKARIVPLKAIENAYVTVDPSVPASIVIRNPYATPFTIEGKPLVISPAVGRTGMQTDVPTLTTLGLARVAIDDPAWEETTTPGKAFEGLISRLSVMVGRKRGRIKVSPKLSLAFEMSIPKVAQAMLALQLNSTNMLLIGMTDWSANIDRIAKVVGVMRESAFRAKAEGIYKIIMVVGIVLFLVFIGMYILRMAHGGGP